MWELDCEESWALKTWWFWNVLLEKTLESPLDWKKIQAIHPKGHQPWVFTGRRDAEAETPILWPPHEKSWLIGKDPDAGRDWRQEEKGTTGDEIDGWHHWLDSHEFESTPGAGDGQGGVAVILGVTSCTRLSDWTELIHKIGVFRGMLQGINSCCLFKFSVIGFNLFLTSGFSGYCF